MSVCRSPSIATCPLISPYQASGSIEQVSLAVYPVRQPALACDLGCDLVLLSGRCVSSLCCVFGSPVIGPSARDNLILTRCSGAWVIRTVVVATAFWPVCTIGQRSSRRQCSSWWACRGSDCGQIYRRVQDVLELAQICCLLRVGRSLRPVLVETRRHSIPADVAPRRSRTVLLDYGNPSFIGSSAETLLSCLCRGDDRPYG